MVSGITIQQYFEQYHGASLLLDVRSPGEYEHAHIPGANSLPLFTNDERRIVGTAYKQESREKAIKIGLKYFGPKMVKMVEEVERLQAESQKLKAEGERRRPDGPGMVGAGENKESNRPIVVHCWRGGMRSAGVAWLLDLYGFEVHTIKGGYKSFRHWCLRQLSGQYRLQLLGGYTGTGKTEILRALAAQGEQVIDLEGLACHKGSAFGHINMPPQPSQEMFENQLALALWQAGATGRRIWLEDESQRIGNVNIPFVFFQQMQQSPLLFAELPFEQRLDYIVKDYGKGDIEQLVNAIIRIQKRLGGLEAKNAIQHLLEGDLRSCFGILLRYYDKWYLKSLPLHRPQAPPIYQTVLLQGTHPADHARQLMAALPPEPA
jgi:tRNA 2-selenouridine synthase